MKLKKLPRILIGAPGSGSGKTTVVCGILQALIHKGLSVVSFKCGPDYIDPMFHREALGLESRNLDLYFTDSDTTRYLMAKNSQHADIAVLEGVMGYYDGLAGKSTLASSYDVAKNTNTPSVLVIDCKGKSVSILAEIKGFLEFEKDSYIKGVILNKISPMIYPEIKRMIEEKLNIEVLGFMPHLKDCSLESRHLGLVTAKEIGNIKELLNKLAQQAAETIDLDALLSLAQQAAELEYNEPTIHGGEKVRIGIALDQAFCFYYADNLDLLKEMGAELIYFSPLNEDKLPDNLQGIYLGGGYPELYLNELSQNTGMKKSIKAAIENGIPCIAECGGFMYLHEKVQDIEGDFFPMVGAIPGESYYTGKLVRFGYIELKAMTDNLLLEQGDTIKGHEFHYWDSTNSGNSYQAAKPLRKTQWNCIVSQGNLYAGYPHIHFYSNRKTAERFVNACRMKKMEE
ncbi:cobyrinate a,c-diamide synthase [Clostridium aminobutyricum]|uniref:Cobyrinate a,c-diamide synthase n=1 Tax=Clostridium aminobutyricum TaxID=33953 RepID=A0A939IID9_CLOAM|nr:cobyrinate a,c-diamide synthase [Clostridium aminobutyricum]MBN7772394.1 cobyrinate a,c-diamide synthase [Clostridium aminobutyricum]